MPFTIEQQRAVTSKKPRVLVAAGAGSGKTSVLAARVLDRLRHGVDVDRLVVLTFTNAAAAEMRTRIKTAIAADPQLADQLRRLDNAVIATFDSFTLRIVRANHHLLGLPRDVGVADAASLSRLENETLDATIQDLYGRGEPWFLHAVDRVWNGGDDGFADAVKLVADGLRTVPDASAWLSRYRDDHYSDAAVSALSGAFRGLLQERCDSLRKSAQDAAERLRRFADPKVRSAADAHEAVSDMFQDPSYAAFRAAVFACKAPSTPAKSKSFDAELAETCRAIVEPFRKRLKKLKAWFESLYAATEADLVLAWRETEDVVMAVMDAARGYRDRLACAKRTRNMFGFDDVTDFAIRLIETDETVRRRYQDDIVEIMVDEYQDTNDAQDRLVDLLSGASVFMVGDVKQSIYGFRNANPGNFLRKCRDVASQGGELISLVANFRSRPGVLATVNALFDAVMDESLGGVDYADGQSLLPSREDLAAPASLDDRAEVIAYEPGDRPAVAVEAELLARIVAREMASGTPVSEKVDGTLIHRPCRYGDFCVLVDRKSDFAVYQGAFTASGIPVFAVTDERFVASSEILFVLSVLRLVRASADPAYAKDWFRHALYGAARSFVFAVPDDLVLPIVADRSLVRFPSSGLPEPLDRLSALVAALAASAPRVTAEAFLASLYERTDIYRHAASLPDPAAVEAKLDFLLEKAASLPLSGFSDLFDYIEGVAAAKDLDVEFKRPLDLANDAVVLMTMHKAKGLEFPFCLYPGLSKRFNHSDTRGFFLFDRRFGLITKAFDDGFKDTFVHALYRSALDRDLISERIRLFYVALTRAREKQFLLLDVSRDDGFRPAPGPHGTLPEGVRLGYDRYADMINSVAALDRFRTAPPPAFEPGIRDPRADADTAPADVAGFAFVPRAAVPRTYAKRGTAPDEATKAAMETGVRFHALLEQFDFRDQERSLAGLDPVWRVRLERFLAHPELSGIAASQIYRELDFVDGPGPDAGRGTIDLLYLDDHGATVVDYKLKHLDDPGYRTQLAGYADYVRKTTGLPVRTYLYSILDDQLVETGGIQP